MGFLRILESIRNPFLNIIFYFFTLLGEEIFVIAVICLLYWCVHKQLAYKVGFAFFASGLMVQTLKITFRIPRPWVLDESFLPLEGAMKTATSYSFPSGHTQSGTALFATLGFFFRNRGLKAFSFLIFVFIGFSRMYLGVHTPKDVFVSMILTFIVSWMVYHKLAALLDRQTRDLPVTLTLLVISLLISAYALILLHADLLTPEFAADCCKAAGAGLGFAVGWYLERRYINFSEKAPWKIQAIKYAAGLTAALVLKISLKLLLGESIAAAIFSYSLLVFWVIFLYPALFHRLALITHKE